MYKLYSLLCTQNEEEDNMLRHPWMAKVTASAACPFSPRKNAFREKEEIFFVLQEELI